MKVLDATFLIDYLDGIEATAEYLLVHEDETFIFPAPAMRKLSLERATTRVEISLGRGANCRGARCMVSMRILRTQPVK
jgi:hypothetical protein